ncbi:hypothetical protein BG842_03375 [Haladaptatus sp. W1]|uniref:endonuclease/exonuclease/phosphatase family protein n=1 Tax=Haladaptatus sp. W1 TaxID=1897478 RepID=UPI000849CB47|nr:endonuclease/exonuclease/phosphatase family protein [Haladaptatus sp. W1]ODR80513.1 hypothetical protein BG842_03375 [Haladaptatus sp. W1]
MKVLSWNLNGETAVSDSQLHNQLQLLNENCGDVDVFMFQAVRNDSTKNGEWDIHLNGLIEYFESLSREYYVAHTGDWSRELMASDVQPHSEISGTHNRCNVTVSRWPIERRPLNLKNHGHRKPRELNYYYSHFPEKMLVTAINTAADDTIEASTIEVWNVAIINGSNWGEEKINMLKTVYDRIYLQNKKVGYPVILGGDFNAPKEETSEKQLIPHGKPAYTQYPFYGDPYYFQENGKAAVEQTFRQRWETAEQQLFDSGIGEWGMQDTYLASSPEVYEASTEEYTHIVHNGNPSRKRLDHILVSDQFAVRGCEIWNGQNESVNGFERDNGYTSDHAPVVADIEIGE